MLVALLQALHKCTHTSCGVLSRVELKVTVYQELYCLNCRWWLQGGITRLFCGRSRMKTLFLSTARSLATGIAAFSVTYAPRLW